MMCAALITMPAVQAVSVGFQPTGSYNHSINVLMLTLLCSQDIVRRSFVYVLFCNRSLDFVYWYINFYG